MFSTHSAVPAVSATGHSRSSAAKKCPISSSAAAANSGSPCRTDHDAERAEIAGEPHRFHQEAQRIGAHLGRSAGDVDVDVRHVERGEPQAARLEQAADVAPLLRRQFGRPQMAGMHHQLEFPGIPGRRRRATQASAPCERM